MDAPTKISLSLALFGITLVFLFQPLQQTVTSITAAKKSCSNQAVLTGTIQNVRYSSSGNLIGELVQNRSKIPVFLRDTYIEEGKNVTLFGRVSKFSNQCWMFPDRVETDD